MLSVHGHCHSWTARANELRVGRWVQGPAEFEPTNLENPHLSLRRVTVLCLHATWDLNSSAMSCAPNKSPHFHHKASLSFSDRLFNKQTKKNSTSRQE